MSAAVTQPAADRRVARAAAQPDRDGADRGDGVRVRRRLLRRVRRQRRGAGDQPALRRGRRGGPVDADELPAGGGGAAADRAARSPIASGAGGCCVIGLLVMAVASILCASASSIETPDRGPRRPGHRRRVRRADQPRAAQRDAAAQSTGHAGSASGPGCRRSRPPSARTPAAGCRQRLVALGVPAQPPADRAGARRAAAGAGDQRRAPLALARCGRRAARGARPRRGDLRAHGWSGGGLDEPAHADRARRRRRCADRAGPGRAPAARADAAAVAVRVAPVRRDQPGHAPVLRRALRGRLPARGRVPAAARLHGGAGGRGADPGDARLPRPRAAQRHAGGAHRPALADGRRHPARRRLPGVARRAAARTPATSRRSCPRRSCAASGSGWP